ncbi:MAG: hypothetical protein NC249_11860, partial [Lachnoclostridium sp.]|nr:hypothetical protein [Lachnoclostridium sp.]
KYITSEEAYNLSEGTDDCVYYVGATADIKAMYKSIARNKNTEISPMFCDAPKFSEQKQVYALCIDKDNWLTVVNSDTMLSLILEGYAVPC